MAAFTWNLKKANDELARLEKENGELKEQLKQAAESPGGDVIKAAEAQASELKEAQAKILAFDAEKSKLTRDNTDLKSELAATSLKRAEAEFTIRNPKGEIETRASVIAREIVAAQGGKTPIKIEGQENPGAPAKPDFSKLTGLAKVIACEKFEAAQKALNTR